MRTLTAKQAKSKLTGLIDSTAASHEPIHITGANASAVLMSEDDSRSIQETLYLLSVPGMRESLVKGMKEPLFKSKTSLAW